MLTAGFTLDPSKLIPKGAFDAGSSPSSPSILGGTPTTEALAQTIATEKMVGETVLALGTITCIIFLFVYITKLGAAGDNAKARQSAISGIIVSGIALALLGSLTAVLAFVWGFI